MTSLVRTIRDVIKYDRRDLALSAIDGVADPKQDRAKDLIDIIVLTDLGQTDEQAVLLAATEVFRARDEHQWPPTVPDYPESWRATMQRLAGEIEHPDRTAGLLIARFSNILTAVAGEPMTV